MKNIILILVVIFLFLVSCNDYLEISQIYRFNLETMPVVSRIKKGETVEIRCQITREVIITVRSFLSDIFSQTERVF